MRKRVENSLLFDFDHNSSNYNTYETHFTIFTVNLPWNFSIESNKKTHYLIFTFYSNRENFSHSYFNDRRKEKFKFRKAKERIRNIEDHDAEKDLRGLPVPL